MNVNLVAQELITNFSPEEITSPGSSTYPGRQAAILAAMNGALQELYGAASPWVRKDERGALLYAPTAITIAVTAGSKEAVISSGWADWMSGCTVVIVGHDIDNQIRNADSTAIVLKFPYGGTSGTVAATVYGDSVPADADVLSIVGKVRIDRQEILPFPNSQTYGARSVTDDYGADEDFTDAVWNVTPRVSATTGQPLVYTVETWNPTTYEAPQIRMRLQPAPQSAGTLEYSAMLCPPRIDSVTSTELIPVPFDFVESIFLPVARIRLTASPFFRNDAGKPEIQRAYTTAMQLLYSLDPRKNPGVTLKPRF